MLDVSTLLVELRKPCLYMADALADRETARLALKAQHDCIGELKEEIAELEQTLRRKRLETKRNHGRPRK